MYADLLIVRDCVLNMTVLVCFANKYVSTWRVQLGNLFQPDSQRGTVMKIQQITIHHLTILSLQIHETVQHRLYTLCTFKEM